MGAYLKFLIISVITIFYAYNSPGAELTTVKVAGGFSQPLFLTAPAGDLNRVFIVEQGSAKIR